jgi:hypothetical protein
MRSERRAKLRLMKADEGRFLELIFCYSYATAIVALKLQCEVSFFSNHLLRQ